MTDNPLAPALDAIAARLKADAERIAALEADLARHIATALDTNEALWKAEAELAALNGRRCETCRKFGICEVNRVLWSEFHEVEIGCTRWAERRAG
jgi:hypothetical protein